MRDEQDDSTVYNVVVNLEEQYSIWPAHRQIPAGWREAGKKGTKKECLDYIEEVWTDMRPLSLRKQMEEMARAPVAVAEIAEDAGTDAEDPLVARLSEGSHPVKMVRCGDGAAGLRERIEIGYVHVLFTETGTELGVRIESKPDESAADFAGAKGTIRLEGKLKLNEDPVICSAQVDLSSLMGEGRLVRIEGE
ncbi:MAG TPA: MbtH family protein [Terracidiphilus sp.]|nr:MbtH family protein [Terracidiphilus sp.]